MSSVITLGLSEIQVGTPVQGGMATDLKKIGKTYKDTCKITQDQSDATEHFEEDKAAPEVRIKEKKIPVLTFSIMDPDEEFLAKYVGGDYAPSTGWSFDGTEDVEPLSFKVIPKQGLEIEIPKGDIEAVINAEMTKKGIFLVDFTVTPLTPDKAGLKAITAKKKA